MEGKIMSLKNKIDFAIVFTVKKANPNGDPLNGNRPRVDYEGFGEVSDVCLKRKLRNRLQDMGENIFVQSDNNRKNGDTFRSLKDRFDNNPKIKEAANDREKQIDIACKTWYDVRAFGQVFAFKKRKKSEDNEGTDSVSIGVRGPVSIQSAFSLDPVDIFSQQITKSVNLETQKDPDKKGSDTMGMKHRVEYGVYVSYGSINCQLAEKTGFSDEDADKLLAALKSLFVNDESSARPAGSMKVEKVVWWKHNCKNGQYASADVHESISIEVDEKSRKPVVIIKKPLDGLEPIIYDGENK
jgi:CRISPR-associated protein Csd2